MAALRSPQQSPQREGNVFKIRSESPTIPVDEDMVEQDANPPGAIAAEPMAVDSDEAAHARELDAARTEMKTPEPKPRRDQANGQQASVPETSPSTPGHLAPFDWEDFEARYTQALTEATQQEQDVLAEFEKLSKYFNIWATSASVNDNERGIKRLQTRERYVQLQEQTLAQKKKHLTEVVRAFQSALALLSEP